MSRRHRHKSNHRDARLASESLQLDQLTAHAADSVATFERGLLELGRITAGLDDAVASETPLPDNGAGRFDPEFGVPLVEIAHRRPTSANGTRNDAPLVVPPPPVVVRVPQRVSAAQALLLLVIVCAAIAAGYWWPDRQVRWGVDLRIQGDVPSTMSALRKCEDDLLDPLVLREAARRLTRPVQQLEQLLAGDQLRIDRRIAESGVRMIGICEDSSAVLQAWVEAWRMRRRAEAAATEQTIADLRASRGAGEQALMDARAALEQAQRVLDADPVESELRRLRASAVEVIGRYDTVRREADSARLVFNREENMTEDDAARTIDSRRMAEAEAYDDVLASDVQELRANAELLQTELLSGDADGAAALNRLADAASAGRKELPAVIAAAELGDSGDVLERVGRALHDLDTTSTEFLGDWRAGMTALRGWNAESPASAIIERQRTLHDGLSAFIARAESSLEQINAAIDDMLRVGDEFARRSVLRNQITRLVMPVRVATEDLSTALDALDTSDDLELDTIRRAVILLSERTERRRLDVQEMMRERLRQEWRESHQAQIAAARRTLDEAVARREAVAAERDAAQTALHDALQRTPRLDGRRHEVALRETEMKAASAALADIESRLADAQRSQRDNAGADWQVSQVAALPRERTPRVMRAAAAAGIAGMTAMLLMSLFSRATPTRRRGDRNAGLNDRRA